jgi:CRP-like cAMP-binding protein
MIDKQHTIPTAIVENTLKSIPLFSHLSEAAIARLGQALLPEQLEAGDVLFHQGDHGTDMFIVTEGAVKVVLADEHGREILLNECGPGEVIGELALLSQEPRAATIIATRPTRLLKLTRDVFLQFLETVTGVDSNSVEDSHRYLRQRYRIQLLKRIDWLSTLSLTDLAAIAGQLRVENFARDDTLFQRGDPGDAFYIIVRGWVNAFVTSDEGSMIVLNQFGPGDSFGEMALLDNKPRSAGIMALAPLEVLTLNRAEFLAVLREHPSVALETLRGLSRKLRFAATYVEKAIAWSQRIADGDYSMVLDEIEASQHEVVGARESDDFSVSALLSALYKLTQGVQQREDELRQEITALKLRIEINEEKRQQQVQAITQSPFFTSLRAQVQKLREENQGETQ